MQIDALTQCNGFISLLHNGLRFGQSPLDVIDRIFQQGIILEVYRKVALLAEKVPDNIGDQVPLKQFSRLLDVVGTGPNSLVVCKTYQINQ